MKNILLLLPLLSSTIIAQSNLTCQTFGTPSNQQAFNTIGYFIDNIPIAFNGCQVSPAIHIAIIDSACSIMNNCNVNFGQANLFITGPLADCTQPGTGTCSNHADNYFIYRFGTPGSMDSVTSFLNRVTNGSYVLAYTWFTDNYSNYPTFKSAFTSIGASLINTMPDSVPYIFFIQKGNTNSLIEMAGLTSSDTLVLNTMLGCSYISNIDDNLIEDILTINANYVNHSITLNSKKDNLKWTLHDLTGKLIADGILEPGNTKTVDNITSGNYILSVTNNSNYYRKKIFIN